MKTFDSLDFQQHPNWPDGIRAKLEFPNGYTASVIQFPYSYGGTNGLYELAIINADNELDYTTPITDDVLGDLSKDDVTQLLQRIADLPKA